MRTLAAVAGVAIVALILWDAFEALVLPRRVTRRLRPTRFFYQSTWLSWKTTARSMRPSGRRETYLSYFAPLSLLDNPTEQPNVFGVTLRHLRYLGLRRRSTRGLGIDRDARLPPQICQEPVKRFGRVHEPIVGLPGRRRFGDIKLSKLVAEAMKAFWSDLYDFFRQLDRNDLCRIVTTQQKMLAGIVEHQDRRMAAIDLEQLIETHLSVPGNSSTGLPESAA